MKFCMQCGHELGASRTCAECGTTAPVEPLPAPQLPRPGARYPLFADEVDSVSVSTSGRVLTAPVPDDSPDPSHPVPGLRPTEMAQVPVVPGRRAGAVVWVALAVLVVGALGIGGWLLLHGGSSADPHASGRPAAGTAGPGGSSDAVAATASAPVTRPAGVDTAGHRTSYAASNMLDGKATTAWEMPGDGAGQVLTFTLAERTHLSQVGLVNGYAKTAREGGRTLDWYSGNRRVLEVEWLFDDGRTVHQDLRRTRRMQTVPVDVTTDTVRLRLVAVSSPGKGPARRNMTAISEVRLDG